MEYFQKLLHIINKKQAVWVLGIENPDILPTKGGTYDYLILSKLHAKKRYCLAGYFKDLNKKLPCRVTDKSTTKGCVLMQTAKGEQFPKRKIFGIISNVIREMYKLTQE